MEWPLFWTIALQVVIASLILRILAGIWGYRRSKPPAQSTTTVYTGSDSK